MRFLLSLLAGAAALAAQAQPPPAQPTVRLLVQNSLLAGFRYAEGAEVWPQLSAGDALELVREPDNPHDANAVRVEWRGRKLGYVPRAENGALAWAMDRGEALRARVSRLAEHRNPRRRIEFEVYIE